MRSDFYAILHKISEKLVFDLPVQKVCFRAPLAFTQFEFSMTINNTHKSFQVFDIITTAAISVLN